MSAHLVGLSGTSCSVVADALVSGHGFRAHDVAAPVRQALTLLDPLLPSGRPLSVLVGEQGWAGAVVDRLDGPEVSRLMMAMRRDVADRVLGATAWMSRVSADVAAAADLVGGSPVVLVGVELACERSWVLEHGGQLWHVGDGPADERASVTIGVDCSPAALGRRVERELRRATPHICTTSA